MLFLTIFITVIYIIVILLFIIGFDKVALYDNLDKKSSNSFSIIIPFRDEAENLPQLLESLIKLDYPTTIFEIILVDDESTDNGKNIIKKFKNEFTEIQISIVNNIRKSNSPKKDAIETAIYNSKFDWIITTDTDCIAPKKWLSSFDNFIQKNSPKMICAPVTYKANNTFLEQFQLLDFLSLIGVTIGSFGIKRPFMCNGANLCYHKSTFFEVDGFKGNNNISSGDDVFLLEKIIEKHPNDVHYLKSENSIIVTKPETNLISLFKQRIRWASKTVATKNQFGKFVGIIVFLMNLLIITLIGYSTYNKNYFYDLISIFSIKIILDFVIIFKTLDFTKQSKSIIFYPIAAFLYPLFSVLIVFTSFFQKQIFWKGRPISIK